MLLFFPHILILNSALQTSQWILHFLPRFSAFGFSKISPEIIVNKFFAGINKWVVIILAFEKTHYYFT